MHLLGAKVVPVESGIAHPQGRHQRGDPRLGRQRRPHGVPLRHGGRSAPVPERWSATSPAASATRPASSASTASAGCPTPSPPASAAGRTRSGCSPPSSTTPRSRSTASRPAARASTPRGTPPRSTPARRGVLHGARTYVLQDEDGQTIESHSISAGLDYPGRRAPARPPRGDRPGDVPPGHRRRGDGRDGAAEPHRGDHPGHRVRARGRRRAPGRGAAGRREAARGDRSWSTSPAAATRTWAPPSSGSGSATPTRSPRSPRGDPREGDR